jgi:hypothetical protein
VEANAGGVCGATKIIGFGISGSKNGYLHMAYLNEIKEDLADA